MTGPAGPEIIGALRRLPVGDVELAVRDAGQGPPLLLVHGFPLSHAMWRYQLEHFAATNRVLAPDLRGFGSSDVTPGTVTMEQFADDLVALLDALGIGEPVTLCGLSMGGYVAFQFARKHADRLAALVLCDTKSAADTAEAQQVRLTMAATVLKSGTEPVSQAMLPRIFAAQTFDRHTGTIDEVRRMIGANPPQGIAAAQRGMASRPDVTGLLPTIGVPALVVVGEHDAISPLAEMRQIAVGLPDARLRIVPDAGHMSPLENPVVFNRILEEFLERLGLLGG